MFGNPALNSLIIAEFKTKSQNKEAKKMCVSQKLVLTLLIVILAFLFPACSHVVVPRGPIPVKMEVVGPINVNKEISLGNGVTESKLTLIGTKGRHKWFGDFMVWTSFIVSQLENELKSRGVQVKSESQDHFRVRVESVGLYWGFAAQRCIVLARVEKKDGTWSKAYEGNNASGNLYRAIDGAVHKVVVAILQDKDFINAISR